MTVEKVSSTSSPKKAALNDPSPMSKRLFFFDAKFLRSAALVKILCIHSIFYDLKKSGGRSSPHNSYFSHDKHVISFLNTVLYPFFFCVESEAMTEYPAAQQSTLILFFA